jgi:hypothetical protein
MKIEMLRSLETVALPAEDERRIRLVSGGIRIRWRSGVALWQWPVAVEVDGQGWQQRRAIPDATRAGLLALFLGAALFVGLAWLIKNRNSTGEKQRDT